ncbi:MAG: LPS biosynthesis protein [Pusillimonas sp.]|jgi:glycosyltransferase involved in cell wall biosynthesis|nr:LPS biosynthesis protein [Pusillimonas sp.]
MTLSVIIITKNESAHIAQCIKSVQFADEIIVLDSGSEDNTREIATELGARVAVSPDWPGFGPQKNRVLDMAKMDWVLSVDADERVTPELAQEILNIIASPQHDAYKIARLSWFGDRWIRHCGWWPDYVVRLFRRGQARFSDAAVHEKVLPETSPGVLQNHFLHYPYTSMEVLIDKVNRYSSAAAQMMYEKGRRTSVAGIAGHAFWTFVRIYLIRRGFLDGKEGFILAVTAAAGSFFRYSKLRYMQSGGKPGQS